MNRSMFDGFVKKAQEAGMSVAEATALFKTSGMDPAAMAGGPPPSPHGHHGGGGPPPQGADMSQGAGVPPELEQLISQLPPEALEQLLQEIQAEMANGGPGAGGPPGGGAGGPPPGGGMPPQMDPSAMGKQGSQKILAKEAGYIDGFVERGLGYGFSKNDINEMYKKALSIMEPGYVEKTASAQQATNSHFAGFLTQARAYGISDKEAEEIYIKTFNK